MVPEIILIQGRGSHFNVTPFLKGCKFLVFQKLIFIEYFYSLVIFRDLEKKSNHFIESLMPLVFYYPGALPGYGFQKILIYTIVILTMPYQQRPRKRNPVKKRVQVYGRAGVQLYKDVQYLKGLVNSEPKYHIVQSTNNFNYNGIVVSLSSIPSGGGVNDRDGNSVLPRYLNINLLIGALNTADTPAVLRMILFRYWGESTNTPGSVTVAEILSTTGTLYAPFSHLNDDNTGSKGDRQRRIEILNSEFVVFDLTDKRQTAHTLNYVMNTGEPKEHIKWNSSATAEPVSGGLYILFISDTITNSKYVLESKLTFYDN